MTIKEMAFALSLYTDYYDTVHYERVEEAVEDTKNETGLALAKENIPAYHQYISETYI